MGNLIILHLVYPAVFARSSRRERRGNLRLGVSRKDEKDETISAGSCIKNIIKILAKNSRLLCRGLRPPLAKTEFFFHVIAVHVK